MGSLFQLRDFWYTSFPGEEFSASAVALADPDISSLFDKIVIGSFQGMLRIMNPGAVQGPMLPGDLLLEKKYGEPILQLECGPFRPYRAGSPPNLLAILFPRKLLLVEISAQGSDNAGTAAELSAKSVERADSEGGAGEAASSSTPPGRTRQRQSNSRGSKDQDAFSSLKDLGAFYTLTVQNEVQLEHTAYNFASGSFGNVDYKLICVQAMDGLLTIVDYNGIMYRTFFPQNQFLVPGPLHYCMNCDALLTCNSSMFLLSYSFTSLVLGSTTDEASGTTGAVRASRNSNLRPQWAFNLGEDAVDIAVCRLTRGLPREEADIVVLCSTLLYVLSEKGEPRMIRHLDVEAAALCVYPLPGIQYDNLLVGTFNGLVQVYMDTELQWSAAVASGAAPLFLTVATMCGVDGMIVNLCAANTLSINYLGTDPVAQRPQSLETKATAYSEIVHDLKQVEGQIQQLSGAINGDGVGGSAGGAAGVDDEDVDDPLALAGAAARNREKKRALEEAAATQAAEAAAKKAAAAMPALTLESAFGRINAVANSASFTVTAAARATLSEGVTDVTFVVQAVSPLLVEPQQCLVEHISPGGSVELAFTVKALQDKDLIIPSCLDLVVVAVFRGARREYETVEHVAVAPLPLVARPVAPVKNTAFSIQINTDQSPPPSLTALFADMTAFGNVAVNVLSVRYLNGADATVLVSKNAARFKVQGSTMEGLWLLTAEVARRVRLCYADQAGLKFEVPDEMPVPDFLAVVDTHWAIRKEVVAAGAALDDAATLFRAVEKRLLARFRDRSPADATAVDVLFQESYKLLQERADAVTRSKTRLRQASAMLSCCARLVWLHLEMKAPPMPPEHAATLSALFSCPITEDNEGGWEEVTEAILVKLLDVKAMRVATGALEIPSSIANLKKCLTTLTSTVLAGHKLGATEKTGS